MKYLFWILIRLHTKITSFLGNMVRTHCSCALYWFHDLWITIMLSLFFMFDAVGNVLQCSEYVPYRFLGWSNIIFWKFSLAMYICFGISIFPLQRKTLENLLFCYRHNQIFFEQRNNGWFVFSTKIKQTLGARCTYNISNLWKNTYCFCFVFRI